MPVAVAIGIVGGIATVAVGFGDELIAAGPGGGARPSRRRGSRGRVARRRSSDGRGAAQGVEDVQFDGLLDAVAGAVDGYRHCREMVG